LPRRPEGRPSLGRAACPAVAACRRGLAAGRSRHLHGRISQLAAVGTRLAAVPEGRVGGLPQHGEPGTQHAAPGSQHLRAGAARAGTVPARPAAAANTAIRFVNMVVPPLPTACGDPSTRGSTSAFPPSSWGWYGPYYGPGSRGACRKVGDDFREGPPRDGCEPRSDRLSFGPSPCGRFCQVGSPTRAMDAGIATVHRSLSADPPTAQGCTQSGTTRARSAGCHESPANEMFDANDPGGST
jgi:hypothetical protein